MNKLMKWSVIAVLVALPALGWAIVKHDSRAHCPITPNCPCEGK